VGKLVAFVWMSIDGVFDADYMGEWFFPYDTASRRKFIKETYAEADALLMGRTTYEMLASYWSPLSDEEQDGIAGVLTHTPKFIASSGEVIAQWGETTLLQGDVEAEVKKLKQENGKIIIIGSAILAKSLASAGLIDEYKLLIPPAIVGEGKQFFSKEMKAQVQLSGLETLDENTVLVDYAVKK